VAEQLPDRADVAAIFGHVSAEGARWYRLGNPAEGR
jgi:hypothetical protein